MSGDNHEWSALLKDILRTQEFRRAPLRAELLRYLLDRIHKPQGISRKTLAAEVFNSARYDEGAVGERCLDLRNSLKDHADTGASHAQTCPSDQPPTVPPKV